MMAPNTRRHSKGVPISPPESFKTDVKDESQDAVGNYQGRSSAPSVTSTFIQATTNGHRQRQSSADTVMAEGENGPAGVGLEIVGAKVKILVDAISKLRQYGLDQKIPLPELVLIGDQSSGKSSLMGALAEIILPSKEGICTRCPANVKTSAAADWKCDVSLDIKYEHDPRSRKSPFPNWKLALSGQETKPFKTIHHKQDLEEVIVWAQHALLNPHIDPSQFIPGEGGIALMSENALPSSIADYSPNVISIEIYGPDLQSLSFYDLPGVFQVAADNKTQYLAQVFENMTKEYIKHENAQVICAMPMSHDISNSRTLSIILNLKADKRRCMGVLTMPDRLQGTHAEYEAVLAGKAQVLPQGYFVTKQPGPNFGINTSDPDYHQIARQQERDYFENDWPRDWARFRHRCGTNAISSYLSHQFAQQIALSIPEITLRITAEAERIDIELSLLPAQSGVNVQHVVRDCLSRFSNSVRQRLEGSHHSFLSSWNTLAENFRTTILLMRPKIGYAHPSDKLSTEVINLDPDDEDVSSVTSGGSALKRAGDRRFETPTPKRIKRLVDDTPIPMSGGARGNPRSGSLKPDDDFSNSPTSQRVIPHQHRRDNNPLRDTPFSAFFYENPGSNFSNIGEIRTLICRHRIPGKPDHVDESIKENLCLQAVENWRDPLDIFMKRTFAMLRAMIMDTLKDTLVGYQETSLFRDSEKILERKIAEWERDQLAAIKAIFNLESYKLFTLNEKAFAAYRNEEMQLLKNARRDHRAQLYVESTSDARITPENKAAKVAKVSDDQLGKDPFEIELELAGYVRGYYVTSGLRFSDNVSQSIYGNLFRIVGEKIGFLLETSLGLNNGNSDDICRRLLEEDSAIAEKRQKLLVQKEKLNGFSREFNRLKEQYYSPVVEEPHEPDHTDNLLEEPDYVDDEMDIESSEQAGFTHFDPKYNVTKPDRMV